MVGPQIPDVRVVFGDSFASTNHVPTWLLPGANLAGTRIPTMFGRPGGVAVSTPSE